MLPALSQVCSLGSPFEKDVEDYAAGACRTIEIWLGKLETFLESHTTADVLDLLAAHEVTAPVAAYQGGLLSSQGEARRSHWDHFQRRLALCRELGIKTLVLAADIAGPLSSQDLDRVQISLADAARHAAEHDVRLALEFQARSAFLNNLETALAMIDRQASPHLGVCLDMFHFWTGASKWEDMAGLTRENLFHVQLCDVAGQARELATDADRILPGDGDFAIEPLVAHLRRIDYDGVVSVELMNPEIWSIPARAFGEVAMTALRKVLGLASME